MGTNDEQIAFWNGTAGERWVVAQEQMDRTIGPLGDAAMDAAKLVPGLRVLDVGCGCGDTTVALAARGARPTGVDISAPMLARARVRAPDLAFIEADASTSPLPEVDLVFSRFGVMFFDDPVGAFAHLRGSLATGGRLAFVCWRTLAENAWARVPLEGAVSVLGPADPPPVNAPGPFAFAKESRIREILDAAGFSDVRVVPHDTDLHWALDTSDAAVRDTFVRIGPAARRIVDAPEDLREPAIQAIIDAVRPYATPAGFVLPAATWVVTAAR